MPFSSVHTLPVGVSVVLAGSIAKAAEPTTSRATMPSAMRFIRILPGFAEEAGTQTGTGQTRKTSLGHFVAHGSPISWCGEYAPFFKTGEEMRDRLNHGTTVSQA